MRLDQAVAQLLPDLSRSFAAKLIQQGRVRVGGQAQTKPSYQVEDTGAIQVDYDQNGQKVPDIDIPVIYEDDDCIVINKPVGLLTHSKGAFNPEATVATWLAQRAPGMTGERAGIVHRLDRATSGVMICAKTPAALSWLQKQFSQRKVKKTYRATVKGILKEPEALIDLPIERNPKKPQTFRVGSNGKAATTAYRVIATNDQNSLLELKPETGRTHQLRVHLNYLGHPIIGDVLYDGPTADRLYLHAESLEITLPSRQRKTFEAPMPPQFEVLVQ